MHALQEVLQRAQKNGVALGHFNISDFVQLKAVFFAAQKLEVPVLVGASEGEREPDLPERRSYPFSGGGNRSSQSRV
jgi:fructose/tagatose bisphosphate aldolase